MRELVFFPTPNWFISRTIDINESNGSLAITAINSIILTNNLLDEYNYTIKEAHTKRLHGVSFGPGNLLASCSEDFDVKVWNLDTRALHFHHKLHQCSVTCIEWLYQADNNKNEHQILISCDTKGNLFKYNLTTSEHTRFYPESNKPISQLCIHRNNPSLAAVGYKHGTIMIIDLCGSQIRLIHKLKSHEDAISCLTWIGGDVLASSGEDRCVRVWRINEEATEELKCLKVPGTNPGGATNRQQQTINYTPLCSPRPGLLLTASYKGELFYFDLEKSLQQQSESNTKWTPFISLSGENQHHKKAIFSILSYNDKAITLSLDRLINIWDLNSFKQESSISSVNGFIYSISSSPIDPTFFAVSIGDSSIKFFNEKQDLKCTKSFTNNIKTEVTQVSWHPFKENLVAFGTKDGKVGLADIMAANKPAQYIYSNFNQSVYTLIWAEPLLPPQNDQVKVSKSTPKKVCFLYSVADAKIIQHHIHLAAGSSTICSPNVQSTNFYKELIKLLDGAQEEDRELSGKTPLTRSGLLESGLTELAVNENYFAIGKYDGSIEIYQRDPNLRRLATLYNHQKLVTCIRWNSTSSLFASGSNDFNIIVVDFSQLIADESNQTNQKLFAQFKHKLSGHKERITGLNWSLINPSLLVSCSYDGTVQIWNGELGTSIANFRGHSEKMLCCVFSNIDTNIVFSGGEDYCLLRWKIDAQKYQTPPDECIALVGKKRNKIVKKQDKKPSQTKPQTTHIASELTWNHRQPSTESEIDLTEKADETPLQEAQEKVVKIETDIAANQENKLLMRKPVKSGSPSQRELKTLFVLSSNLAGVKSSVKKLNDCLKLFETLYEKQTGISDWKVDIGSNRLDFAISDQESSIVRLFGNRISVFDMLRLETAELKSLNYEKWWILEMWKGDLSEVIAELRKQDTLNELVILVYETVVNSTRSPSLINAYIEQLLRPHGDNPVPIENVHKAAVLSLALIDPERAVRVYLEHDLYAYALCISQVRFPPHYHILYDVLVKYASYATSVGDYETAVMCFLRVNDVENAFATLLRRNVKNDEQCASIFVELSQKFEQFIKSKPK